MNPQMQSFLCWILDSILDLYNIQEKKEFWPESKLQSIDPTITPEIERINVVYESMVNTFATEHSKFIAKRVYH